MDQVFDALAHPIRRQVLELLKGGSMTAGDLAEAFAVSKPTMSAHFAKLKAANLVQSEHRGGFVHYSLNLSVMEEVVMGFMERLRVGEESTRLEGDAA